MLIFSTDTLTKYAYIKTHNDPFDYMVGETRVVCNPRGYAGHDEQADVFEVKFLDI